MRAEHWLYTIPLRFRAIFKRGAVEAELDEELRFHLEEQIAALIANGHTPDAARTLALRAFGGVEWRKEQCRDTRRVGRIEELANDLRYSLRTLARSRGLTATAVISLALGIGASTTIFGVVNALMLRLLPVRDPDRLVMFRRDAPVPAPDVWRYQFWYSSYARFRDEVPAFSSLAASCILDRSGARVGDVDEPGPIRVGLVTGNYFSTLGVSAMRGRTFTEDDDRTEGGHAIAVVSHAFWQRRFAGSASVLGQTIVLNRAAYTIVGVGARGFSGEWVGRPVDVWIPSRMHAQVFAEMPDRLNCLRIIGRLRPRVSLAQAQAIAAPVWLRGQLEALGPNASAAQVEAIRQERLTLVSAAHGYSQQRASFARPLRILLAIVGVVLVVTCANIATLLLVRSMARRRETTVRLALGASRWRVARQHLTESLVLAVFGGALGVLVSIWGTHALAAMAVAPVQVDPRAGSAWVTLDLQLGTTALALSAALAIGTALAFGLWPALRATRVSLGAGLSLRGSTSNQDSRRVGGQVLIVAQVALSLALVVAAGLFVRTLRNLEAVDVGVDREHVMFVWLAPGQGGRTSAAYGDLLRRSLSRIERLGGVVSASASNGGFLIGTPLGGVSSENLKVDGLAPKAGQLAAVSMVAPRYFETTGLPLIEGREFTAQDTAGPPRLIVNETFARFFFGNGSALGKHVGGPREGGEIIGVVRDTKHGTARDAPRLWMYAPLTESLALRSTQLVIRTAGDPASLVARVKAELHAIDPTLPVLGVETVRQHIDSVVAPERILAGLGLCFGSLAAALAALGLYGVVSYGVARRTSEIGVRLALGAPARTVLALVICEGMMPVLVGVAIGVPIALLAARSTAAMLFGVRPVDPVTLFSATTLILGIGVLACLVPASRASRLDPLVALRTD
jgi:predicted permease